MLAWRAVSSDRLPSEPASLVPQPQGISENQLTPELVFAKLWVQGKREAREKQMLKTYRMIVTTETPGPRGSTDVQREQIRHIPESELCDRRNAARMGAPLGSTRLIKVLEEN